MRRYRNILTGLAIVCGVALAGAVSAQTDNETCLGCHNDSALKGVGHDGTELSMFVTKGMIDSSVHAGMNCVDCHADLNGTKDYPHAENLKPVNCGNCHDDVVSVYVGSAHGAAAAKNPKAPSCTSCHDKHRILSHTNPEATTSANKLPYTCSSCHHALVLKRDPDVRIADSFDRYMRGVHAEGVRKGIGSAASCNDCHGVHDLKKASDPASTVNKMNIPKTCSKCHNDIYIQYSRGIHGKALAAGILDSPNCTDCHGEHDIRQIADPTSPVNASNLSDYVCAKCHNDPRINEKFGLVKGKFTTYQDSYHGLAVKGGSVKAATCASCHKAHDIMPKTNPASSIHPDNLAATCMKCHPRANAEFAASYSHNSVEAEFSGLDNWIRNIYILAIILIIGSMMGHNLVILSRFIIEKHRQNKGEPTVERFSGGMVYQHLMVTASFILLVVTGFALRYPDQWWAKLLNAVGIDEGPRGVIHRIAALLLVYISVHHALFLLFTRRGKVELRALMPNMQDAKDIFLNLKYYLGKSDVRPRFDRYDYTEKAEYWALVWGTFVMAATGAVLWFPTFFTAWLPAWVVKIAETIHLYEAWLATLAIAVFHFFFVIFHPDQYPMSLTWITGRMTIDSCKHHHPAWFDRIAAGQREGEKNEVPESITKPNGEVPTRRNV
jgi:cytochrome b subunit of formate dehydrogenase